jgi:DNA-binding SARP family transcriptional activator/tetratricopeptide (TPR) repeat protein
MVYVRLLGGLTIAVDGQPVDPPASRRAQSLLGWLALNPGMHARSTVAGRFWPDVLDSSARQSMRSAAWALRRALGPTGEQVLHATRDEIGIDGITTDVGQFEWLVAEDRLVDAVALVRGDLLAGLDDDWIHEARDEQRARLAVVLERLANGADKAGDARAAVDWTRKWAALDPLAEAPARALMRRLAAGGDRAAALAVYARLRERMRLELQVSPSAETREVAAAMREDEPEREREPERRHPSLPLIGRGDELARLDAIRSAGAGGVAVLTGEGGIGKTRLATEVLDRAAAAGTRTATCAALDMGAAAPFSLWAELLRELVRALPAAPHEARWPADLARLVPELSSASAPPAPPELERARLFEATVELFEWASADRPVVVLVDDVHLADPASLELFAYAGRRMPATRVLILATRRAMPPRPELDAAMTALARRGALLDELALAPLPADALAALVRSVASLPDEDVARVAGAADGNALLAVESARATAAGERGPAATLRASVRAQLGALDDDARLLVELLAVSGRDLDRGEQTALGIDGLAEAASAGVDSGLLAAAARRIGYRHALLREAVYEELPEPRRAALHERLADALAAAAEPGAGLRDAEVARHLLIAGASERAVEHLTGAAAHARGVAALPEAAGFLHEALEIDPGDAGVWLELAEVEAWRSSISESDTAFERVLDLLDRGDPLRLVDAWLRRARWFRGAQCVPHEALAAYRSALALLDAAVIDSPHTRAEALAGWAWAEAIAGDTAVVDDLLSQVHDLLGRDRADDLLTHDVAAARQFALMRAGRFADSYAPGVAAGEAAQRAGRPDMAYGAWGNAAAAAAAAGDLDRALEFADRSLYAARGTGLPLECAVLSAKSQVLARMGRLDDARAVADLECQIAERLGRAGAIAAGDHDRGVIELLAGRYDESAGLLGSALDRGGPFSRPMARLARAEALARAGRVDDAEKELRATALEPVKPSDFPATLVPRLTRVQALVALARGDRALAEKRLEESAAGWRRQAKPAEDGAAYLANLVDLGRPAITGLVEPIRELRGVEAELESLRATVA